MCFFASFSLHISPFSFCSLFFCLHLSVSLDSVHILLTVTYSSTYVLSLVLHSVYWPALDKILACYFHQDAHHTYIHLALLFCLLDFSVLNTVPRRLSIFVHFYLLVVLVVSVTRKFYTLSCSTSSYHPSPSSATTLRIILSLVCVIAIHTLLTVYVRSASPRCVVVAVVVVVVVVESLPLALQPLAIYIVPGCLCSRSVPDIYHTHFTFCMLACPRQFYVLRAS